MMARSVVGAVRTQTQWRDLRVFQEVGAIVIEY